MAEEQRIIKQIRSPLRKNDQVVQCQKSRKSSSFQFSNSPLRNGKFGPELDRRKSNSFVLAAVPPPPAQPENLTIQATISAPLIEQTATQTCETSTTNNNPTENITLSVKQDISQTSNLETASNAPLPEVTQSVVAETTTCDKEFQIESFQITTKHKYVAFLIPFLLLMLLALGIVVLL